jgi:hypothetical protein
VYDGLVVLFPYDISDPKRPVSQDVLEEESPLLLDYYVKYESIIRSQTEFSDKIRGEDAGEFYGLARTGAYSFANCYVTYRDNTSWRACVVTRRKMPWGENKRFVFQNHAVSMCERTDGGRITAQEAHYITAIFNAPIVRRFVHQSSDGRSFKIRPPVYVPLFDPSKPLHQALGRLGATAHKKNGSRDDLLAAIEDAYLAVCTQR